MSSKVVRTSGVTSVSYSFALKWILTAKQLKDLGKSSDASVARSDLYQLKTNKDLHFYLEIKAEHCKLYEINIKGPKIGNFELAYGFSVTEGKAFLLKYSPQLSFLDLFYLDDVSDSDVTIHCVVNACSVCPASFGNEEDLSLLEGQNIVDFEDRADIPLPNNYTNKMVIDFIRKGDLPTFGVGICAEIIRDSPKHECQELKILCTEYLMKNINGESFRQISRVALDNGILALERKCLAAVTYNYLQVK